MTQIIEAPTKSDVERIAYQLIHAEQVVEQATGRALTGGIADLALLQATLDANFIEPEATYSLQALGIAFGKVFIENTEFYDWWNALSKLKADGLAPEAAICVIDRQSGGSEALAKHGLPLRALFTIDEIERA